MQKQATATFEKGINHRSDILQGDPSRLYTLQNARMSARGSTFSVSRIEGYVIENILPTGKHRILDMIFYGADDHLVVYWCHQYGTVYVEIFDVGDFSSTVKIKSFVLGDHDVRKGELIQQRDAIFVSPFNKMVNKIEGEYYLNGMVADYPKFKLANVQ